MGIKIFSREANKLIDMKRNAPEIKVGDPVLIVEDDRPDGKATGVIGTYEGEFPHTVGVTWKGEAHEYFLDDWLSGRVMLTGNKPAKDVIPMRTAGMSEGWFPIDNPRILLPDGTHIWGMECWWKFIEPGEQADLSAAKKSLEKIKKLFNRAFKEVHTKNDQEE